MAWMRDLLLTNRVKCQVIHQVDDPLSWCLLKNSLQGMRLSTQSGRLRGGPEARRKPLFGRTGSVCDNSQEAVIQPAHPEHVEGYERAGGTTIDVSPAQMVRQAHHERECMSARDGRGRGMCCAIKKILGNFGENWNGTTGCYALTRRLGCSRI